MFFAGTGISARNEIGFVTKVARVAGAELAAIARNARMAACMVDGSDTNR